MNARALRLRVDELAVDVGRLRRHAQPESTHHLDRVAGHVAATHGMVNPSAAELVAWTAPGDEDAIAEALRVVDEEWLTLRGQLGGMA